MTTTPPATSPTPANSETKSKRPLIIGIAIAAVVLVAALIGGLFYGGVFTNTEDRMEAVAADWVTAVNDDDVEAFKKLTAETLLEYQSTDGKITSKNLQEFREFTLSNEGWSPKEGEVWKVTGIGSVTLSTTDFDEGIKAVYKSSFGENISADVLSKTRDDYRVEMKLDTKDIGWVVFTPEFSSSSGFPGDNQEDFVGVAQFDISDTKNPRLLFFEVRDN